MAFQSVIINRHMGLEVSFHADGIYLPQLDLWLDPQEAKPNAWLSHAHGDHARGIHQTVIGTRATLDLYADRWPSDNTARVMQPLEYGVEREWRGALLKSLPAGHILGAAQLLVNFEGERLVYTGDIKLQEPLCGTPTEMAPCDRLIIESTFGLPVFHFLSREQATARILRFARECFEDGATPAFLGYSLGRGQEIVNVLCQAGIPTAVHGAIARYLPFYEAGGFRFAGWEPYDARATAGRALVVVPGMRNILEASGKNVRIAYVSGWAMFASARTRSGADELIPYSDHAGFDELLQLIRGPGARRVDLVHGYTEPLAHILKSLGIEAEAHGGSVARATLEDPEG